MFPAQHRCCSCGVVSTDLLREIFFKSCSEINLPLCLSQKPITAGILWRILDPAGLGCRHTESSSITSSWSDVSVLQPASWHRDTSYRATSTEQDFTKAKIWALTLISTITASLLSGTNLDCLWHRPDPGPSCEEQQNIWMWPKSGAMCTAAKTHLLTYRPASRLLCSLSFL